MFTFNHSLLISIIYHILEKHKVNQHNFMTNCSIIKFLFCGARINLPQAMYQISCPLVNSLRVMELFLSPPWFWLAWR